VEIVRRLKLNHAALVEETSEASLHETHDVSSNRVP
jgi:hypothetical protein